MESAGTTGTDDVTDTATCPAGETLIGGGLRATTGTGSYKKTANVGSYPQGNSWVVTVAALTGFADTLTVVAYAICA
ncbi:MAG: hypothetical protein ACJ76I_14900 [Gaiellaceae bacterium]